MGTCIDVQPGWQVLVDGSVLARPLLEAVSRAVGRRGAYALQRVNLSGSGINVPWALEAPEQLLASPPAIEAYMWENADALVSIEAPENTRELTRSAGRAAGARSRRGCARISSESCAWS